MDHTCAVESGKLCISLFLLLANLCFQVVSVLVKTRLLLHISYALRAIYKSSVIKIDDKNYLKAAISTILCFCPLPRPNNVEKQLAKLASSYVVGLQHCIGGEGGFLNTLFRFSIIFCHWLSEIYQKQKDEVLYMLSQMIQICFNEPD